MDASMRPGDLVAIGHASGFWTPWRFEAQDARGIVLAGVLPTQPPQCVIAHAMPMVAGRAVVFTFRCLTCAGKGMVEHWLRRKIAGPSIEELRGAERAPDTMVVCPTCDGEQLIPWDPFRERPTCAMPPGRLKITAALAAREVPCN